MTQVASLAIQLTCFVLMSALPVLADAPSPPRPAAKCKIVCSGQSQQETLAAKEIRRYLYLRTGNLFPIVATLPAQGDAIVVESKTSPALKGILDAQFKTALAQLPSDGYSLHTQSLGTRKVLFVVGGGPTGTLYGAYALAENFGVRFYLDTDVIPDGRIAWALPNLDESHHPLFAIRGINPFHDFQEGPDWWEQDDYLCYLGQLAKMKMNFIGLHCYPEGKVGPEPLVWIGPKSLFQANGDVTFSYPAQWASMARKGMWGTASLATSQLAGGAGLLFDHDWYAPAVQSGLERKQLQQSTDESNRIFNRVGKLLDTSFTFAKQLGVKTCVGFETPLHIPAKMKAKLKAMGKNPDDPAVRQEVYEGIFRRIVATHPLDYFWLWTPETWTWRGNSARAYQDTIKDILAAHKALATCGTPFQLATCGWVLGPKGDRAGLDRDLPRDIPVSSINRVVGHSAVGTEYRDVKHRGKWAIPWMENDPNMVGPQPWAARMRYDAADARAYGCTGLIGIHWRTHIMSMNVSALAQAAWDQSYIPASYRRNRGGGVYGPLGGKVASFRAPVKKTETSAIYQTVRYGLKGYRLDIPNGTYTVKLLFNEPYYDAAGKRHFGVNIQGKQVVSGLDLFKTAGKNVAYDVAVPAVCVTRGALLIEFTKDLGLPCIAGIIVEGRQDASNQFPAGPYVKRFNCGGPAVGAFVAEGKPKSLGAGKDRAMPIADFYEDWARAQFGPEVAKQAGTIFTNIDGTNMPVWSDWHKGPGTVGKKIPRETFASVQAKQFGFVDQLEALAAKVQGPNNQRRFAYWLNTFRYLRALAEVTCKRGELDRAVARYTKSKAPADLQRAIALRVEAARRWEAMIRYQIHAVESVGELGTIANLEAHSRVQLHFLNCHDALLREANKAPLPEEAAVRTTYTGAPYITVPTKRTQIAQGEALSVRVLSASSVPVASARVFSRPMGQGTFSAMPLVHRARGVYEANFPKATTDFEYFIRLTYTDGTTRTWPAPGEAQAHTVLVWGH